MQQSCEVLASDQVALGPDSRTKALADLLLQHRKASGSTVQHYDPTAMERESIFRSLRMGLHGMTTSLGSAIDDAEAIIDASRSFIPSEPDQAGRSWMPTPESIIAYAHTLRYTTFAHAGLISQPPAPQQAQMCNSVLFRYSHGQAATAQPSVPLNDASQGATSTSDTFMDMDIPDGWKPGDPLPSFPSSIQLGIQPPEMPAGWKPGDPIPGLDSLEGTIKQQPTLQPSATISRQERLSFILNPEYDVSEESDDENSEADEW